MNLGLAGPETSVVARGNPPILVQKPAQKGTGCKKGQVI